jgi:hypothetical protein
MKIRMVSGNTGDVTVKIASIQGSRRLTCCSATGDHSRQICLASALISHAFRTWDRWGKLRLIVHVGLDNDVEDKMPIMLWAFELKRFNDIQYLEMKISPQTQSQRNLHLLSTG